MNLVHLKYAVEVAKTNSITKAAENLYMGQPNLSRAIKELEENLGIEIFKRSSNGIKITPQGEEFLGYARKILAQVDAVENMYKEEKVNSQKFSVSVPRASYISCAFTEFSKRLDSMQGAEIFYKETNSMRAISNILNSDYKLGILRYQSSYDKYFKEMLKEKGLAFSLIGEFNYVLAMSKNHPLTVKEDITPEELAPYIEIAHADPYVPSLPTNVVQKNELSEFVNKRIFVFERASQMELLSCLSNTFMWVSPIPQKLLDRYDLVQKQCSFNKKRYKDVLIYKKEYNFSDLDKLFIDELMKFKRDIC